MIIPATKDWERELAQCKTISNKKQRARCLLKLRKLIQKEREKLEKQRRMFDVAEAQLRGKMWAIELRTGLDLTELYQSEILAMLPARPEDIRERYEFVDFWYLEELGKIKFDWKTGQYRMKGVA